MSPSSEIDLNVREALPSDAARIVALAAQLGYDVPLAHAGATLEARDAEGEVLVAIVSRVGVVGWVDVRIHHNLLTSREAVVEGLVVDEEFRGAGIGGELLAEAERWAGARGCGSVRVRSNAMRERAHAFYEARGYALVKSQRIYEKAL